MRPTGVAGVIGLVLVGLIIADIWRNPTGTNAAGNALVNLWTPSVQGVAGQQITYPKAQ